MLSNLNHSGKYTDKAFKYLEKNASFLRSLFAHCDHDREQITTIIEPILNAPKRCEVAPFYIQAVVTDRTTFLITNLSQVETLQIVDNSDRWLIGRSRLNCAIAIPEASISRKHAVIGHDFGTDFYIKDAGSRNGTRVNHRRLAALERCLLCDGDLIELGLIKVEFFITSCQEHSEASTRISEINSV